MTSVKRVRVEDLDPDVRDTLMGYQEALQRWGAAAIDDHSDGLFLTALLDCAARLLSISAPDDFELRKEAAALLLGELSNQYRATLQDLQEKHGIAKAAVRGSAR